MYCTLLYTLDCTELWREEEKGVDRKMRDRARSVSLESEYREGLVIERGCWANRRGREIIGRQERERDGADRRGRETR